jgi:heme-degrading monooxygenase HmoA
VEPISGADGVLPREYGGALMHARSITIMGDPSSLDDGVAFVRDEVMPAVTAMDGCVGLSMLVDRDSGQCIVTSSWESEEAMNASDLNLSSLRRRGGEIMGGTPSVEAWEVAVMRRDHPVPDDACCRVTWIRMGQGDMDRAIEVYRHGLLPQIEQVPGFCGASMLVDRATGRGCGTVAFESLESLDASRDQAWTIRESGAREAGVDIIDVAEYSLAIAHLRLPELV